MATVEQQLLSKIIRSGNLSSALEWGISSDDFLTSEGRMIFNTVQTYNSLPNHKNAVIGPNLLQAKFPQLQLCDDPGVTIEALCSEVRKRRLTVVAKDTADKILEHAELDPIAAINEAQLRLGQLQALGLNQNTDVSFLSAIDEILTDYEAQELGLQMAKVSWPWEIMNEMTGGLQDDDYIVFYGRPKSMKSWVVAAMIAHCLQMCIPILVYTKEMTPKNIIKRVAAIVVGVAYQELRRATLLAHEKVAFYELREYVRELSVMKNFTVLSGQDVTEGGDTIAWLKAKVDKYKPGVVFVDGLYLMSDGSKRATADWTRVTAISRAARQMQLSTRIPLVCTVQANRRAAQHSNAEFDEIAYADAIGQDATIAMRVIAEKAQPTIACVLAGSREFKLHGFRIGGVPCTDFSYKEVLTEKDIEKAKKDDHSEKEIPSSEQHAKERKKKQVVRTPNTEMAEQLNGVTPA